MFQFTDSYSCPFFKTTTPVLGLIQPSVPWLTVALSLVVNRQRRETYWSLRLAPRFRICGAVPQALTRLHDADKDNLIFTFTFSYNGQSKYKLNIVEQHVLTYGIYNKYMCDRAI